MHIFEWTHVLPFILGHGSKLSHCECRKGIHKLIIQNCKPVFTKSEKIGKKNVHNLFPPCGCATSGGQGGNHLALQVTRPIKLSD